ncbi:MAG: hypothetical protein R3D25_15805 [Geminicoccaceae bacterium]
MLRPLAEGYASSPRTRQNAALAYGLRGEMAAPPTGGAGWIWPMPTSPTTCATSAPSPASSRVQDPAAIQPDFKEPVVREAPGEPRLAASRPAAPVTPVTLPAPATATAPKPLATAPVAAPTTAADASGPARPAAASAAPAGGAPATPGPTSARSSPRSGSSASRPPRSAGGSSTSAASIRRRHERLLASNSRRTHATAAGLTRLAGGSAGTVPMIVGPFATAAEADALCAELTGAVVYCNPVRL